jgi:hypothetical protein
VRCSRSHARANSHIYACAANSYADASPTNCHIYSNSANRHTDTDADTAHADTCAAHTRAPNTHARAYTRAASGVDGV